MNENDKEGYDYFRRFLYERTKNFALSPEEVEFYRNLVNYFTIGKTDLNRDKGIFIRGAVGTGKTLAFKLIQKFLMQKHKFSMRSSNEIVLDYNTTGDKILKGYSVVKDWCFDDFGSEDKGKHFGSECEVMEKIILLRYDLFEQYGTKTHLTSNFSNEELNEKYGARAYDRLKRIINVVNYPAVDSKRSWSKLEILPELKFNNIDPTHEEITLEFLERCVFMPMDDAMLSQERLILHETQAMSMIKIMIEKGIIDPSPEFLAPFHTRASDLFKKTVIEPNTNGKLLSLKDIMSGKNPIVTKISKTDAEKIEDIANMYIVNDWLFEQQKKGSNLRQILK